MIRYSTDGGESFRGSLLKEQAHDVNVNSMTFLVQIAREWRKVGEPMPRRTMNADAFKNRVPKRIAPVTSQAAALRGPME